MNLDTYMNMDPKKRVVLVALHLLDLAQEEGWIGNCGFTTEEGAEVAEFAMSNGDRPTKADLLHIVEIMLASGRIMGASAEDFVTLMMGALDKRYP